MRSPKACKVVVCSSGESRSNDVGRIGVFIAVGVDDVEADCGNPVDTDVSDPQHRGAPADGQRLAADDVDRLRDRDATLIGAEVDPHLSGHPYPDGARAGPADTQAGSWNILAGLGIRRLAPGIITGREGLSTMVQQIARVRNLIVLAAAVLATTGITQAGGRQSGSPPATIDLDRLGPQIGARLPDFMLRDQRGEAHRLKSLLGPKGAMIVFFRSADW